MSYSLAVGREAVSGISTPQPAILGLPSSNSQLVMRMSNPDTRLNEAVRAQT